MTAPKRWPKNAEGARVDSLAAAMQINTTGKRAKRAVLDNNRDLALAFISEMQLAAKDIELAMRLAKGN